MKKALALLLALTVFLCGAASAQTALTPVQTMYQLVPFFDSYAGYYFAEVVNSGDTLICLNPDISMVELTDAQGTVLATEGIYTMYPHVIGPGETAYIVPFSTYLEDVNPDAVSGYSLRLAAEEAAYYEPTAYIDESSLQADIHTEPDAWGEDVTCIYVTFTNQTNEPHFGFSFAIGLYDEEGTLIYTCVESIYDVGVPAGQSLIFRSEIDSILAAFWAENGISPASIRVIGYYN